MTSAPLPGYLESFLSQQGETPAAPSGAEEARPGEWRNLWVWIEHKEGEVLPVSLEAMGRARELADELGTRACAVLFGRGLQDAAARLGERGADRTYLLDAPGFERFALRMAREALVQLVQDRRPEAFFFPATVQGRNLGAQLAAALGTGIIPNCAGFSVDPTERLIVGHQTSYEERLLSDIVCPVQRPQIFTLSPGKIRRPAPEAGRRAQVVPVALSEAPTPSKVQVLERLAPPFQPLERYDAIVAAGLGVASHEGFELVRQLAAELEAYPGATRGAVACGWADPERLITATRHSLRPRLYVAAGVVGEYDHLRAIENADYVVALTADAGAPIAENADLVGVGEPSAILKHLVDAVRKAKKERFTLP